MIDTAIICLGVIGLMMVTLGWLGIIYWDQFGKLSSGFNLKIDTLYYNLRDFISRRLK